MTVAAPSRAAATPAAAGATSGATGSDSTDSTATGFSDLLAALVPGATVAPTTVPGAAGATPDPASVAPSGVCGAGPEVSVSPEDVVVGATDPELVVVGAAGDDAAGSRTGDPAGLEGIVGAPVDETTAADDPAADPTVESALLAQAQLAALPLLAPAIAPAAPAGPVAPVVAGQPVDAVDAPATAAPAAGPLDVAPDTLAGTTPDASADPGTDTGSGQSPAQPAAPAATAQPATDAAAPRLDQVLAPSAVTAPTPAAPVRGEVRAADAVPGQVFPEIVRLSQSGNGTHRVTLRLDPGTLGEVRVTLTVRDGEVQVRLAAQHDAREVLAQAAPDLRRLLEQSGSVDAKVAVADLATGTTTEQSGTDQRGDQRGFGAAADREQDGRRSPSYGGAERSGPAPTERPAAEHPRDVRSSAGLDLAL